MVLKMAWEDWWISAQVVENNVNKSSVYNVLAEGM